MRISFSISTIIGAEDGSGDCLLPIPDALWESLNWKLDDLLEISQRQDDSIVVYKSPGTETDERLPTT